MEDFRRRCRKATRKCHLCPMRAKTLAPNCVWVLVCRTQQKKKLYKSVKIIQNIPRLEDPFSWWIFRPLFVRCIHHGNDDNEQNGVSPFLYSASGRFSFCEWRRFGAKMLESGIIINMCWTSKSATIKSLLDNASIDFGTYQFRCRNQLWLI